MSTALVAPFGDMDAFYLNAQRLVQQQQQQQRSTAAFQLTADRRQPSGCVTIPPPTSHPNLTARHIPRAVSPTVDNHQNMFNKYPSPPSSPPQMFTMQGSPILGQRQLNMSTDNNNMSALLANHRRLERSVSEPVERRASLSSSPGSTTSSSSSQSSQQQPTNSSRYKTELCRPFEESGYCKYGDKCQFAHGMQECRSLSRHPKYKTELCRTFHTIGFCPYGPRCHFIHNEDERRLNQINQLKQVPVPSGPCSPQMSAAQRPQRLNLAFNLSLVRDSLGSTADSPPSSVTDSPSLSPSGLSDDVLAALSPNQFQQQHHQIPMSAPPAPQQAFTFQDLAAASMLAPLNIHTDAISISSLAAGLQAASLNQRNNNPEPTYHPHHQTSTTEGLGELIFNAPPSPPFSL